MTDWYSEHFKEITLIPDGPPDTQITPYPDGTLIIRTNEQAMLDGIARKLGAPSVIAARALDPKNKQSPVHSVTIKTSRYELAHPPVKSAQANMPSSERCATCTKTPRAAPTRRRLPTNLLPKALRPNIYKQLTFDRYRIAGVDRKDQRTVITVPRDGVISLTTSDPTMLSKLRRLFKHKDTEWRLIGVTHPPFDPFEHHVASVTVECDEPLVTLRPAKHEGHAKS